MASTSGQLVVRFVSSVVSCTTMSVFCPEVAVDYWLRRLIMIVMDREPDRSGEMCEPCSWLWRAVIVVGSTGPGDGALADDEALVITPPGFDRPGVARTASGARTAGGSRSPFETAQPIGWHLAGSTSSGQMETSISRPTTGSHPIASTGQWPETGKGNRPGKGPFRYLGRFFYTTGETEVVVPAGAVRVEVWKGLRVSAARAASRGGRGQSRPSLSRSSWNARRRWRRWATILATCICTSRARAKQTIKRSSTCSKPRISSSARSWLTTSRRARTPESMEAMASPQLRGLGQPRSGAAARRWIASGQEYRSTTYGHLNLILARRPGARGPENQRRQLAALRRAWPRNDARRRVRRFMRTADIRRRSYADFVQKRCSAVELLQFGVYRGIGLGGLVRHSEHRLSIAVRRGQRLSRLPQAG